MKFIHSKFDKGDQVVNWRVLYDWNGKSFKTGHIWTILEVNWAPEWHEYGYLLVNRKGVIPRWVGGSSQTYPHLDRSIPESKLARVGIKS